MITFGEALAEGRATLKWRWIENPGLDARLLLADAAGLDMAAVIARDRDELPDLEYASYKDHLMRRRRGEPVARILGEAEFFGRAFKLSPSTLVPRPETEILVQVVLKEARERFPPDVSICDLGTGTGAIAITLLSEMREARAFVTDIEEGALFMAIANAERHGVKSRMTFRRMDFAVGPDGPFDIVVSNPPYIKSADIDGLEPQVRIYGPRRAIDGGADGLAAYRVIVARSDTLLSSGGLIAFEIGYDQGESVAALCAQAGLCDVRVERDMAGLDRVVLACRGT